MKRIDNKLLILGFVLVILCFQSCKSTKQHTDTNNNQPNLTCNPIIIDTSGIYTETDPFLLVNAELKGKCLEIEVEYSGGCGGDVWTLAWSGMLMKSLPPKASIYLHLKDDDVCREIVRKKISFDISSIYNKGEVILFLKDFRGDLVYKPD